MRVIHWFKHIAILVSSLRKNVKRVYLNSKVLKVLWCHSGLVWLVLEGPIPVANATRDKRSRDPNIGVLRAALHSAIVTEIQLQAYCINVLSLYRLWVLRSSVNGVPKRFTFCSAVFHSLLYSLLISYITLPRQQHGNHNYRSCPSLRLESLNTIACNQLLLYYN